MKVIHMVGGLKGGGAEHMVLELSKCAQQDALVDMEVVSLSNIAEIAWKFDHEGVSLFIDRSRGQSVFHRLLNAYRAIRHVLQSKPQVVHAHLYHAAVAACIIRIIRPDTKIVFSLHNTHQPGNLRRLILFLSRGCRHKDLVFPGSPLRWYLKKDAISVPNGIDVNKFSVRHSRVSPFTFLFAGRLEHQKNPLFLIALARILKNSVPFKILVAGAGTLEHDMRKMIRNQQLQEYIELPGVSNNMPLLMSKAHCLLLPSLWEGMPLVMLEAGAAGLPILATPMANAIGLLDSETGYVAGLDNFAQCARHIMNNYDEALARAEKFRSQVNSSYTIGHSYAAHRKIYVG